MQTITTSIVVERPIEEVFAFVTDARNNRLWQATSGLQSTRQVPEEPVGVGTRITEVWKFMGRTSESTSEVTEYEPSRKYVRTLLDDGGPIRRGELTFEPVAEGTRWTWISRIKANGIFAVAEPLLVSNLKKSIEANMAEAKALLERAA